MTKKHFAELARVIRYHLQKADVPGNEAAKRAVRSLAEDLSELCGEFNPNFDPQRFLTACGLED